MLEPILEALSVLNLTFWARLLLINLKHNLVTEAKSLPLKGERGGGVTKSI